MGRTNPLPKKRIIKARTPDTPCKASLRKIDYLSALVEALERERAQLIDCVHAIDTQNTRACGAYVALLKREHRLMRALRAAIGHIEETPETADLLRQIESLLEEGASGDEAFVSINIDFSLKKP